MNIDVAERLISNLEAGLIQHDQDTWLANGHHFFEIDPDDRWSCATSGCAAGHIFLEEADPGMVFATHYEKVFTNMDELIQYNDWLDGIVDDYTDAPTISEWAADKLGINDEEAKFLFYQFGDTEETINRIRFLMTGRPLKEFDPDQDY